MRTAWTPLLLLPFAAACGDDATAPPEPPPVRTLLVHRQDDGTNDLWSTDGSARGEFSAATRGMLPIGAHPPEGAVALLDGGAIVLVTRAAPDRVDTVIASAPSSQSLVSFSHDGNLLALVSYAPTPGVLVYDRVNRILDTLSLSGADPVLPPVFSPDDERLALFTVTDLSLQLTTIYRSDPSRSSTVALRVSRFLNRPLFGWPLWLDDGLRMAFRRVAPDGPDTLLVGIVYPDAPFSLLDEDYRAVLAPVSDQRPELDFAVESTYALTTDGRGLVLGAIPGPGLSRHAVYMVTPGINRVQLILDDPGQYPVFPLFIRE